MSTVYRKTDKGVSEIETRAFRLLPRLRQALILVDGRKTDAELAKLILAEPEATLATLQAEGFIEKLATVADAPPERKADVAGAAAAPVRKAVVSVDAIRRDAVRYLNDQLGPAADRVLDVQWRTEHLASLGVVEVPRREYLRRLDVALRLDLPPAWR